MISLYGYGFAKSVAGPRMIFFINSGCINWQRNH